MGHCQAQASIATYPAMRRHRLPASRKLCSPVEHREVLPALDLPYLPAAAVMPGRLEAFLRLLWRDFYGDEPVPGTTAKPEAYLSESVNLAHASAGTFSVKPSRSVVSRTRIMPAPLAVSTQLPPLAPE
jgi:hypothetical protein